MKFPLLFIVQYNTPGKYSSNWETKWWQIWPTLPSPPPTFRNEKLLRKVIPPLERFSFLVLNQGPDHFIIVSRLEKFNETEEVGARIDFFVTHLIFEHRFRDKPRANSRWHTRAEDFKEWNTNMVPWRNPRDLWNQGENVTSLFNKGNFVDTPPRLIRTWAVSFRLKNDHRRLIARLGNFFFFLLYFNNSPALSLNFSSVYSFVHKKKKMFGREDSNESYKRRKILYEQKSLTKIFLKVPSYFIFHNFMMRVKSLFVNFNYCFE